MARKSFSPDEPELRWITDDEKPDRTMELLQDFCYSEGEGEKDWPVEKQQVVDGASIPRFLWTTVGSPYTGDYRRASIVHDYWCHQGGHAGRLKADRMFRRACLAGGCSPKHAWLLYVGVRIGAYLPLTTADWLEPTLDYQNAGVPNGLEIEYLDVFRSGASEAEAAGFDPDSEELADRIDAIVERQLRLKGLFVPSEEQLTAPNPLLGQNGVAMG